VQKAILIATGLSGLTAVAIGAFGAHGLRPLITPDELGMWEKGVQYQMYHTLAMFGCYLYLNNSASKLIRNAAYCFMVGVLFFSGSLYLLATRNLSHIPTMIIGPITPIGGLFFIAGWVLILVQGLRKEKAV
jgi:uncharacterized membrane protein YgdD (TMEM256/DUF423 family)